MKKCPDEMAETRKTKSACVPEKKTRDGQEKLFK